MRIIDKKNKTTLDTILIMLTPSEASELASKIKSLDPSTGDHLHLNDAEYEREITLAVYTDENFVFFADDIRNIIKSS